MTVTQTESGPAGLDLRGVRTSFSFVMFGMRRNWGGGGCCALYIYVCTKEVFYMFLGDTSASLDTHACLWRQNVHICVIRIYIVCAWHC